MSKFILENSVMSMHAFCIKHFNDDWSTRVVDKVYFKFKRHHSGLIEGKIYYLGPVGYVYDKEGNSTGMGMNTTEDVFIIGTALQFIYLGGE